MSMGKCTGECATCTEESISAVLAGNPNCGKTTLFNSLTGMSLKCANRPGVTVDKAQGECHWGNFTLEITDLPGIYDTEFPSDEETVCRELISDCDVIINVADATNLERSLSLTSELCRMGKPVILALTMTDILGKRGTELDISLLSKALGIRVVDVGHGQKGVIPKLCRAVRECVRGRESVASFADKAYLFERAARNPTPLASEGDKSRLFGRVDRQPTPLAPESDKARLFEHIDWILAECMRGEAHTLKEDRLILCGNFGWVVFGLVFLSVLFLTFYAGGALSEYVMGLISAFSRLLCVRLWGKIPHGVLLLLTEGVVSGVGAVLSFVPQLFILFFCFEILEDTGYMAQLSFLADSLMSKCSLTGRAFAVLLLGLGCTVPAVMSSDVAGEGRRRLVFALPFVPCSARLPALVMLLSMFFSESASFLIALLYLVGILTAAVVLRLTSRGECGALIMELPDFRLPYMRNVIPSALRHLLSYIKKAGTVIFAVSVIMWFILNFSPRGALCSAEESIGAYMGKVVAPILAPCGLGMWQIALALISGLCSKESIVSVMAVIFGDTAEMKASLLSVGFRGENALAMCVFILLYMPCVSACMAIRTKNGRGRTLLFCLFSIALAYTAAFAVYRTLTLCG